VFKGIDKKRHTRTPYEIRKLDVMMLNRRHSGG